MRLTENEGTKSSWYLLAQESQLKVMSTILAKSALSNLLSGSVQQFEGVGHGGPIQLPKLFAEAVLNFVDAVPA